MTSGSLQNTDIDPITRWELAAITLLIDIQEGKDIDITAVKTNMHRLIKALDEGKGLSALKDPDFMKKTETLLLAFLHGERITVSDPHIFEARREIFAAAQVMYNMAVSQKYWEIHPDIKHSMGQAA